MPTPKQLDNWKYTAKVLAVWGLAVLSVLPFWNLAEGGSMFFFNGMVPYVVLLAWAGFWLYGFTRMAIRWVQVPKVPLVIRYAITFLGVVVIVGTAYRRNDRQVEAWRSQDQVEEMDRGQE